MESDIVFIAAAISSNSERPVTAELAAFSDALIPASPDVPEHVHLVLGILPPGGEGGELLHGQLHHPIHVSRPEGRGGGQGGGEGQMKNKIDSV